MSKFLQGIHTEEHFSSVLKASSDVQSPFSQGGVTQDNRDVTSSSCRFMIKIGDMTESNVDSFEEYCPLIRFDFDVSRDINPISSSQLLASGAMKASGVSIIIPTGIWVADIENTLYAGKSVDSIEAVRLITASDTNTEAESWTYEESFFYYARSLGDYTHFRFRFVKITHKINATDQAAAAGGMNESEFDFRTNKAGA